MDHISYLTTMLLTAGTSWLICDLILPLSMAEIRGWTGFSCLGGRLVICSSLSVAIFWFLWHRSERYKQAVGWMKKLAKA